MTAREKRTGLVALERDERLHELLAELVADDRVGLERVERVRERERHQLALDRRLVDADARRAGSSLRSMPSRPAWIAAAAAR